MVVQQDGETRRVKRLRILVGGHRAGRREAVSHDDYRREGYVGLVEPAAQRGSQGGKLDIDAHAFPCGLACDKKQSNLVFGMMRIWCARGFPKPMIFHSETDDFSRPQVRPLTESVMVATQQGEATMAAAGR